MILHICINGRELFAAPFDSDRVAETSRAIREHLPALRQLGRVEVFVTDGNVTHLIVMG